jgi:acyl transferase domain-containing protein
LRASFPAQAGIDSIGAVELRNAAADAFGVPLPATLMFDYPTLASLAAFVVEQLAAQQAQRPAAWLAAPAALQARAAPGAGTTTVALTGLSCTFPTAPEDAISARSGVASFWGALAAGATLQAAIPLHTWDVDALYDPDTAAAAGGKAATYCRFTSTLGPGVAAFDPGAFRLPPPEAALMDPHTRVLLEHVAEAAAGAGARGSSLASVSTVGVYVGCMWASEYSELLPLLGASPAAAPAITGNTFPFMVGRLAYAFGFQGPAVSTDTACSSSLVAMHLASGGLRLEDCGAAVVGGANALLHPHTAVKISALQALSPVGRCRTFDAAADGYGRGEGFAVAVLEPHGGGGGGGAVALLRGSAVNSAGRSSGLTAPSGPAQRLLVAAALRNAGVAASAVGLVAVHGTGTPLGDPIEVGALGQALGGGGGGGGPRRRRPVVLASNKSCFGHTEGAAGLAGAVLAVQATLQALTPPVVGLRSVNPYVAQTLGEGPGAAAAAVPRQAGALVGTGFASVAGARTQGSRSVWPSARGEASALALPRRSDSLTLTPPRPDALQAPARSA